MSPTGAVFQPELIQLMKSVLDDATAMLPEAKRTSTMKAEIASQILACAAKGERDPMVLKNSALLAIAASSERFFDCQWLAAMGQCNQRRPPRKGAICFPSIVAFAQTDRRCHDLVASA